MNWSTITTIVSLLFDFESDPIISILISCYGYLSIFSRWSSLAFSMFYTLFCWYFVYSWTYILMLFLISSHQNFLLIDLSIFYCPGCSISAGSWFLVGFVLISSVSRSQEVDLVSSLFSFPFLFSFQVIFSFLFLALRVRVSNNIIQSHISHTVTSNSHKSPDT